MTFARVRLVEEGSGVLHIGDGYFSSRSEPFCRQKGLTHLALRLKANGIVQRSELGMRYGD